MQENSIPEMIQERVEDVESLYKETQDAQRQLQASMDKEDDLEQELDMWEELKSRKISTVSMAKRLYASSSAAESTFNPDSSAHKNRVKLPKIELPTYSGKYTDWCTFWDTFDSTVHKNPTLSDVERFHYLATSLSGSAAAAIRGLRVTNDNYAEAINILKERFGDKNRIITAHLEDLMKLPDVSEKENNVAAIRRFCDELEAHSRSLGCLGVEPESYGTMLAPVVMGRLPQSWSLLISRNVGDGWNLRSIVQELRKEVTLRERTESRVMKPDRTGKTNSGAPGRTAAALTSTTGREDNRCCLCNQTGHGPAGCSVITDIERRKEVLRRFGRCFVCLKRGHVARTCKGRACSCCGGRHNVCLCNRSTGQHATTGGEDSTVPTPALQVSNSLEYAEKSQVILLQTAEVTVASQCHTQKARLILDSGSQRSYISTELSQRLGLRPMRQERLLVRTFGSSEEMVQDTGVVQVPISALDGSTIYITAYQIPMICRPLQCQPATVSKERYVHLRDLFLAETSDGSTELAVDILVGSDQMWLLMTGEFRRGRDGQGPVACNTRVGWVLSGITDDGFREGAQVNLATSHTLRVEVKTTQEDTRLAETLTKFWTLESLGICEEDESVHDRLLESARFRDGRYEVRLPWKDYHEPLPDNYQVAKKRLSSLMYRLKSDPETAEEYDKIIKEQIRTGVTEVVDGTAEDTVGEGQIHYLPHHPVVREDKDTTKVRVVYDASASSRGPSLNSCLRAGPALTADLLDVLLRFRSYEVAYVADIEKAFHMIGIHPDDRDALRFLWVDNVKADKPSLMRLRFARVPFGVKCSPFILSAILQHHMKLKSDPAVAAMFIQSAYVDDLVSGAGEVDKAAKTFMGIRNCLREAGFNLRKFRTNSAELNKRIDSEIGHEKSKEPAEMRMTQEDDTTFASFTLTEMADPKSTECLKVLGVEWDLVKDELRLNLNLEDEFEAIPTKRQIVGIIAGIYDPMGLLSPILLPLKVFLQELHTSGLEWDEHLTAEQQRKWSILKQLILKKVPVTVPRCLFEERGVGAQRVVTLHGFGDASKTGYAATVYARIEGTPTAASLVASKTRVAPIKAQTIPRLELMAALLTSRLVVRVKQALSSVYEISSCFCWTDSMVVYHWITQEEKEFQQFVENRISEIRRLTPASCWSHCPGRDNPADIPTRGVPESDLKDLTSWWLGPDWLRDEQNAWPKTETGAPNESVEAEVASELKKGKRPETHALLVSDDSTLDLNVLKPENFSRLGKLLRTTALVLRFISNLRKKIRHQDRMVGPLLFSEVRRAEFLWIKSAQRSLKNGPQPSKLKNQLDVFEAEDGLMRCGGRLDKSEVPYETKHPVLLPRDHELTDLIILDCHEKVGHNGVKETLTEFRGRFWMARGRQKVRRLIHQCRTCRRHEGTSYRAPRPPALPEFRVTESQPFFCTGVDFAGPLFIRENDGHSYKVYLVLFTCSSTRAVHLELCPDLSTDAFLRSLSRMKARRGTPRILISDNAQTFKAASQFVQGHGDEIQDKLSTDKIEWKFILERAPWWGGFYERLIRSAKRCLRKVIGSALLTYEELETVVVDVEGIMNSRPLTFVSSEELEEPLTPAHLMTGRRLLTTTHLGSSTRHTELNTEEECTRRYRHVQKLLEHFWTRWQKEYLLQLCQHNGTRKSTPEEPVIGAVVIIKEDGIKRNKWRLGRIEEVIRGADGRVRGAQVICSGPSGRRTTMQRPIQKLVPVEVPDARR